MPRAASLYFRLKLAALLATLVAAAAGVSAARGEEYGEGGIRRLPPMEEKQPVEELPLPATIAPYSPLDFAPGLAVLRSR